MRNVVWAAALLVAAAAPAQAQMRWQDRAYANVNLLLQPASRDANLDGSFPLYDELGTFEGDRQIGGGAVFDLSGGARVWRNLAVGLGFSRFGNSNSVSITARVPDPLVFDAPLAQTLSAGELDHSETAVHISAVWFWPYSDKIDFAFFAGPSIFSVNHQTVTAISVIENTATATGVTTAEASETTVGINIGADVSYMITPRYGAGVLLRYAGGSVEVPSVDSLGVGGFQIGAGLRVRF
jgi:hypothetical protein